MLIGIRISLTVKISSANEVWQYFVNILHRFESRKSQAGGGIVLERAEYRVYSSEASLHCMVRSIPAVALVVRRILSMRYNVCCVSENDSELDDSG